MKAWKEWIELWLMVIGIFFVYVGASAVDSGQVIGGAVMYALGILFFAMMMVVVLDRR